MRIFLEKGNSYSEIYPSYVRVALTEAGVEVTENFLEWVDSMRKSDVLFAVTFENKVRLWAEV